ncbi:MAG: polysaccharide biosynthesis/export family protein [Isosphaeraceae bacterium]|nr:polysaccharide biosynthesis/export family protein [Isosphaeraceae bacterium]
MRLTRRGLAPAAGLVGASIATQASGGALPLALSAATALAACRVAAGVAVKEVVSAESAALFERVLGTMSWKTVGKAALAMAAVGMLVVGAFFAGRSSEESKDDSALYKIKIPKTVKRPSLEPYPAYVVEPPDLIIVEVLDALPGRPISGEHLVRPDGTISLGFYGDVQVAGLTLPEIKEKVILHLRTFLSDEALGLWRMAQDQEMLETGKKRLESKYFKELKPPFTLPPDKSFPPDEPSPPPTSPLPPLSSDAHLFDKQAEQRRAEPNGEADMKPKAEARPTAETEGDSKPQADRRLPLPSLPPVDTKPLAGHQPEPKPTRPEAEAPPMTESGPEKSCETWVPVDPKDSNFVYVDMGAYNSKFYYVLGVTRTNGKFPCTGHETVLDAIENAGGLAWFAAPEQIRLIRPGKGNAPDQVFPIDYAAIAHGVDPSTNYQVFPGDRIVIPADPKRLSNAAKNVPAPASETGPQSATLGHRIEQLEKKLDAVLKALNKRDGDSTSEQPKRPKNEPKRDELDRKPNEA